MGKLILLTEAARRLGLTDQTLRNWEKKGALSTKHVGRAIYVDEDTVTALQDTAEDIARQQEAVRRLRDAEAREQREFMEAMHDRERHRRYYALCVESGMRTEFFATVCDMLAVYGSLTAREADVVKRRLYGETLESIGEMFGLSRERVRQIAEKAIRKSKELTWLKENTEHIRELEADNQGLKRTVVLLREKLTEYEERPELADADFVVLNNTCELLATNVKNFNFTVRALNCMRSADIETVGDLVKYPKSDLMKFRNFGKKSLAELEYFVESHNLSWGMDVDSYYQQRTEYLTVKGH